MQNRKRDRCLWDFSGNNTGVSCHFPTPGDLPHLGIKLLRAKIYKAVHCNLMNYFSVSQFSCSVVSDSLWSYGLEHARLSCSSPIPGTCSYTCPLSRWCHPTISSSVVPFSSCLQSFPASGSFQMSQFFTSDDQRLEFQLQHQSFQWTPRTDLL